MELDADMLAFVGQFSDISQRSSLGDYLPVFLRLGTKYLVFWGRGSLLNVCGSHLPVIN